MGGEIEGEKHWCEREVWVSYLSHRPWPRTEPSTQACSLTGIWTCSLSLCRSTPNKLSHISQGEMFPLITVQFSSLFYAFSWRMAWVSLKGTLKKVNIYLIYMHLIMYMMHLWSQFFPLNYTFIDSKISITQGSVSQLCVFVVVVNCSCRSILQLTITFFWWDKYLVF